MLGPILVFIGLLFLLKNIGFLEVIQWGIIWPILIIITGLWFMKARAERRRWYGNWRKQFGWTKNAEDAENPEV